MELIYPIIAINNWPIDNVSKLYNSEGILQCYNDGQFKKKTKIDALHKHVSDCFLTLNCTFVASNFPIECTLLYIQTEQKYQ